jgi:ethanolamine ammonia-lyase small subunit
MSDAPPPGRDGGGPPRAAPAPGASVAEAPASAGGPVATMAREGGIALPAGVVASPWQALRRFTAARVALGRAGVAVPTAPELALRLAHARARDAVHLPFDADSVAKALEAAGHATLTLASAAADRAIYLQRPDLGRRLDATSRERLDAWRREHPAPERFDLALVVADGLSALAVHRHAAPLVAALRPHLDAPRWTLAPVVLVHQGRVAIGDEIGEALGADCVAVLIGERPGLSSPDSLGLYVSWAPRVGLTDAQRNCISNVRPEGLAVGAAVAKLAWLLTEARRRRLTGVALKDDVDESRPRLGDDRNGNFLVDAGADADADANADVDAGASAGASASAIAGAGARAEAKAAAGAGTGTGAGGGSGGGSDGGSGCGRSRRCQCRWR